MVKLFTRATPSHCREQNGILKEHSNHSKVRRYDKIFKFKLRSLILKILTFFHFLPFKSKNSDFLRILFSHSLNFCDMVIQIY